MNYYVYKYTNMINEKVYIGQTNLTKAQRAGRNGNSYKECPKFWNAIQEFGWQNFEYCILESNLTKEEAEIKEKYYIEKYKSNIVDYGYNIQSGGRHLFGSDNPFYGKTHSDGTKKSIAESNSRRIWTEESKQKIRNKISGINSPFAKPVMCIETSEIFPTIKIAAISMGVTASKICDVLKGRHKTCCGYHWIYADS